MSRDTRSRIQDAARELFARKGVQRTSLQEIADQLGITKPALYYHFASREDLVRSIVQPLIDDGEAFIRAVEAEPPGPRALLEGYFDFHYRHRREVILVLTESSTLVELDLIDTVLTWRGRLAALLVGADAPLEQAVRAVLALGGLQDCTVHFADTPAAELREPAVAAALATLGR
ncbi:TetR/AcrR family transcriptional regulator [Actinokineospora sp. NPDC004072]